MAKAKFEQTLIEIPLPVDVFDVETASVMRSKRVSVQTVTEIRRKSRTTGVPWEALAKIFPKWNGVVDVETGEALPNPEDDPLVFTRLDYAEQVPWFVQKGLSYFPNQTGGG